MRYMVDTNVVLDLILGREPFVSDAIQIFSLSEAKRIELILSTDAISTIFYIVAKNKNRQVAKKAIASLLDFVSLGSLDERSVLQGLALDFDDVEDALVVSVANSVDAQAIITRNGKDFRGSSVPVMSPKEFLAFWSELVQLGESGDT